MAQRRMFNLKIVDTDAFLEMPQSTQNLYFHLGMRADDEGFVGNINRVMKMLGNSEDDKKILIAKRFVLEFASGVIVIKHWKMNNYLQNDRIQETNYLQEKGLIYVKDNGVYTFDEKQGKPLVDKMYTKCIHSIVESSIEENSIDIDLEKDISADAPQKNFKKPLLEEVIAYCKERNNNVDAEKWFNYYTANGFKIGRTAMKDWKAAVRTWERNNYDKPKQEEQKGKYAGMSFSTK